MPPPFFVFQTPAFKIDAEVISESTLQVPVAFFMVALLTCPIELLAQQYNMPSCVLS